MGGAGAGGTADAFVHTLLVSSKSLSASHLNKAQSGVLDGTGSGLPTLLDVQPRIKAQSLMRLSSDCPVVLCFSTFGVSFPFSFGSSDIAPLLIDASCMAPW